MSPQLQKEELSAILHICCKPLGLLWYLGTTKFHLNDSEVITTDLDTKGTWLKWTLASKVSGTYLTLGPKCSLNEKEVWEPKSFSMFENFRMRSEGKKKKLYFSIKIVFLMMDQERGTFSEVLRGIWACEHASVILAQKTIRKCWQVLFTFVLGI